MHQIFNNDSAFSFKDFFVASNGSKTRGDTENVIRTKISKKNVRIHSFSDRQGKQDRKCIQSLYVTVGPKC
jgi:hypothetical protein